MFVVFFLSAKLLVSLMWNFCEFQLVDFWLPLVSIFVYRIEAERACYYWDYTSWKYLVCLFVSMFDGLLSCVRSLTVFVVMF